MPPSSPLNPYAYTPSSHQLSSPISSSSLLPPTTPRQHQDELASRRRSFFKQPASSRSLSSSPGGGSPSASRHQPTTVSDELWRDRFKKKCDDRVRRDKERTARRRRADGDDGGGGPPSSDPLGDGDALMDMGEDGQSEEAEDEDEKEIFRRIIRAQQRRTAERTWGTSLDAVGDLDRLLVHEQEDGPQPQAGDGMSDEPPEDDIDQDYLDFLLSQQDQMEDVDTLPASAPPLAPPPCPACDAHPPLTVNPEGGLTCLSCSSSLTPEATAHIEAAWTADGGHTGPEPTAAHQIGLLLTVSEYGETTLEARCFGLGCEWAVEVEI